MRHVIAWSVLLTLALPVLLLAQPAVSTSQQDAVAVKKASDELSPGSPTRPAALERLRNMLTDKADEGRHQYRAVLILEQMAAPQVPQEKWASLRDMVALWVADSKLTPDVRTSRWRLLLDLMANKALPAEQRTAARDALIRLVTEPQADQRDVNARKLADLISPSIAAPADVTTAIDALTIIDQAQHVALVPVLLRGLDSPNWVVRYLAAKGLADVQLGIYRMGEMDVNQFSDRVKAIAACFNRESNPLVIQELYRALGANDLKIMTDIRRNAVLYQVFKSAFSARAQRLGAGNLKDINVEIAGLTSLGQWEQVYRGTPTIRAEILRWPAQIMFWAAQIMSGTGSLTEPQEADLQHLMLKAADVICGALQDKDLTLVGLTPEKAKFLYNSLRRDLEIGDAGAVGLLVLDWVGGPGFEDDYKLKKLGVPPAVPMTVSASQPD